MEIAGRDVDDEISLVVRLGATTPERLASNLVDLKVHPGVDGRVPAFRGRSEGERDGAGGCRRWPFLTAGLLVYGIQMDDSPVGLRLPEILHADPGAQEREEE